MSNGGSEPKEGRYEQPCVAHLLGDTDRSDEASNDRITPADEAGKRTWTWGRVGRGAVVLFNCDDDKSPNPIDATDARVNARGDVADLMPLKVSAWEDMPEGWTAQLRLTAPDRVRVFEERAEGADVVLGPEEGAVWPIDLSVDHVLGVEARGFPGDYPGDPEFDFILEVYAPGREEPACTDTVRFRIAPWLAVWNGQPATELHICEVPDNAGVVEFIRKRLPRSVRLRTADGVDYCDPQEDDDRWIQDWLQFGDTHVRNHRMDVVLDSDRAWPSQLVHMTYAYFEVLGKGIGYAKRNTYRSTLDSFGNLEVSPPVRVRGSASLGRAAKDYLFGRVYYGHRRGRRRIDRQLVQFLRAQIVQHPFPIPTGWLDVSHADEIVSFIPARFSAVVSDPSRRFRLLIASPRRAIQVLRVLRAVGHGDAPVLRGRFDAALPMQTTVRKLLDPSNDLIRYNLDRAQQHIDRARARMVRELDLRPWEIIEVPVLFHRAPVRGAAYTGDMVNLQVVVAGRQSLLFVPKPFGPEIRIGRRTVDAFELDFALRVGLLGNTIHFIDVWDTYHQRGGEIHCGTAVRRRQRRDAFWWQMEED